jgi:hypothetical protein
MPYQSLNSDKVVETIERLCQRIEKRFPDSGLSKLCRKLLEISRVTQERTEWIAKPILGLRIGSLLLVGLIVAGVILAALALTKPADSVYLLAFVQVLESGTNDIILIGAAIFFLVTLEGRIKRGRALRAVHELRVIAHIVDMHQLTKDPERLLAGGEGNSTAQSGEKALTPYQLGKYLDYCAEMLSLCSKVAVLYVQNFNDPVVLAAVNEIESLTSGLSRKIWQKMMFLQSFRS